MRSSLQLKYNINLAPDKGYFGQASTDGDDARYQESIKQLNAVLAFSDTSFKDRSFVTVSNYIKALKDCRASTYYRNIKSKLIANPAEFIYHSELLYYACVTNEFETLDLDILQDLAELHKEDDFGTNLKVLTNACAFHASLAPTMKAALQDSLKKALSNRAKKHTSFFLNLENIQLEGIDLRHSHTLSCINLNGANLAKAQLTNMTHLNLQKANLSEVRFVATNEEHKLTFCMADEANLQSAIGTRLNWTHASFNRANLTNADLTVSYFAISLNDANLTRARLINISDRPGGHASMQNAILHSACLDNILLTDSTLTQGIELFSFADFFSDESLTLALDEWYYSYIQGMQYNALIKNKPDFISGYVTAFQLLAAKNIKCYLLSEEVRHRHDDEEIFALFDAAITHTLFQPVSSFSYYANSIYARFNQTFFGLLPRSYSTYHLPYQTPAITLLEKARDELIAALYETNSAKKLPGH